MAIELPEDAGGRDIPSDAKVSYGADGNRYGASRSTYSVLGDCGNRDVAFACGKGRPPMRGTAYRRRHRDPTAIFPEKCEPKGVDHD